MAIYEILRFYEDQSTLLLPSFIMHSRSVIAVKCLDFLLRVSVYGATEHLPPCFYSPLQSVHPCTGVCLEYRTYGVIAGCGGCVRVCESFRYQVGVFCPSVRFAR